MDITFFNFIGSVKVQSSGFVEKKLSLNCVLKT